MKLSLSLCLALLAAPIFAQMGNGHQNVGFEYSPVSMMQARWLLSGFDVSTSRYPHLAGALMAAPAGSALLEPFALALQSNPELEKMRDVDAVIEYASRRVDDRAANLRSLTLNDPQSFDQNAAELEAFASKYGLYMAPHTAASLYAKAARRRALSSSVRMAVSLGTGPAPDAVPASGEVGPANVLPHPANEQGSFSSVNTAVPAPPVPDRTNRLAAGAMYMGGAVTLIGLGILFAYSAATMGLGAALFAGVVYQAAFVFAATWARAKGFPLPSGILATLAVLMVPVIGTTALAIQDLSLDNFDFRFPLVLATLGAAVISGLRFRHHLLALPSAAALIAAFLDLLHQLFPQASQAQAGWAVVVVGLATAALGRVLELRIKGVDFARWFYFTGLSLASVALYLLASNALVPTLLLAGVGTVLLSLGAILNRKSFLVLGAGLFFTWFAPFLWNLFDDFLLRSLAGVVLGLGTIAAAGWYQRHAAAVGAKLRELVRLERRG
jgi:hypothetical protein